jgi:hypothetical protein
MANRQGYDVVVDVDAEVCLLFAPEVLVSTWTDMSRVI